MKSSARFWDKVADRYSKQPVADEASYQTKLGVTRKYLRADMKVLEIGCGTGSTAISHAPHVAHIRAIDISSNMIEIARAKAEEAGVDNVTFDCASIDEVCASEERYDAVLALSILHLVDDREAVIARVYDMLEPRGVFVTSTVCLGGWKKLFRAVVPIGQVLGLLPLLRFFGVAELVESLTDAGFEIAHRWQPGEDKAVFIVASKASGG